MQYIAGFVLIMVGVFVVVGGGAAAVIKAIRDALVKVGSGRLQAIALNPADIIGPLLKTPITLAIIAGALIIWLGLCMANGGTWLFFITFSDPRPLT